MAIHFSLRTRITIFVAVLVLVAAGFLTGGIVISQKRSFWAAQLHEWDFESVQVGAECRAVLQDLNFKLLSYQLSHALEDRARFDVASAAFAGWLEERRRESARPEIREALGQILQEYAHYQDRTKRFLANLPQADAINPPNELFEIVETDSGRLLDLESRLRSARRESLTSLVARAREDLDRLWNATFACLFLLLACLAVLARLVYRDLIAPLLRTVAHTRALLERREKLSALGLLAAGLAHEIRNPLNSVKARLFTQRRVLGEHSPGLEDNQFIDGEIDRLEGIVNDTLQFARPAEPTFQPMRVRVALEALCELLRPALAKSAIELKTDFQADSEISADPNQLKQALLNLVNNAADSVGRSGTITLRARPATLQRKRRRVPAVGVEVQDTGPGLTPEAKGRLFDPFFTTKENGTGLGLSITARIVDAHGGLIECESPPGRGALFRILLPITHEPNPHSSD
jgi:signal transduction histidine kinase